MTTATEFQALDANPEVAALTEQVRPVLSAIERAERRFREIRAVLDPTLEREHDDPRARRAALLDQPGVERELLQLQQQRDDLFDARRLARQRAFEAALTAFDKADAADLAALDRALNDAARIEQRRAARRAAFEDATGRQVGSDGAWPELLPDSNSRLSTWREWARRQKGSGS